MKRVKAWAVVNPNRELNLALLYWHFADAESVCLQSAGERVVPVVIEIQEEK